MLYFLNYESYFSKNSKNTLEQEVRVDAEFHISYESKHLYRALDAEIFSIDLLIMRKSKVEK